jgi:predicted RNA binding protein YcfA (HicA-like mRNA interferase family)
MSNISKTAATLTQEKGAAFLTAGGQMAAGDTNVGFTPTQKNCRFVDIERLLAACGFDAGAQSGSHVTFRRAADQKRNALRITVPRHRPVKTRYVKEVLFLIGERPWEDLPLDS